MRRQVNINININIKIKAYLTVQSVSTDKRVPVHEMIYMLKKGIGIIPPHIFFLQVRYKQL